MKFFVTHLFTVLVDADNATQAEAKFDYYPTTKNLEETGKVVRTSWQIEADESEDKQ